MDPGTPTDPDPSMMDPAPSTLDPAPGSSSVNDQAATDRAADYDAVLDTAASAARSWLDGVFSRPIPAVHDIDAVKAAIGRELPRTGIRAETVIEELAEAIEPGLMASQSSRFFGWVMGGTYPVALAADWLVSAWDQNAGMRDATPGVVAAEELAGEWLLQLLGLPAGADVGFVTGATSANFVGLAAGRHHVLEQAGWDVNRDGMSGAPHIRLIAGAERHGAVDLAARYLGLGEATLVPADVHGRISIAGLARALSEGSGPAIVCLQAGNIHSGAFDDFAAASALCKASGAWQHVDGAFGLWAAAAPGLRHLTTGYEMADSWATDAHKTLNVPYDCGVAIVARPEALHSAFGVHASYLLAPAAGADPFEKVPEMSRRARGVPLLATLRWLGREGVEALVTGLAENAGRLAEQLGALPGVSILNDVVFTQVCMAMADDESTVAVGTRLFEQGRVLASPSRWHDRAVLRFSVSNWATDADEVRATVDAVRGALQPR